MIKEIRLTNFKRYPDKSVILKPIGLTLVAGGNNSGKSTLLHALAVWEFCKLNLLFQKGQRSILAGFRGDGLGMSVEEFTPVNIPSLKYLWTNLQVGLGYNLKIRCIWDTDEKNNLHLEIGLSLTQERIYIKTLSSNLSDGDKIPTAAYVPPFAGILDKETWVSPADRKRLIGKGLSGAVLRNTIIEYYNIYKEGERILRNGRTKVPKEEQERFRAHDTYSTLNKVLSETFALELRPQDFLPSFHNFIRVDIMKGTIKERKFYPHPNFNKRDIMVEGSGFLQWLSVYTFAINKDVDILLLDEPDAHLHCSLQSMLTEKLKEISAANNKQILMASHSTEIIKELNYDQILEVKQSSLKYLSGEENKIGLISGLGTDYAPRLNKLQKCKKVLFVENHSDANILKLMAENLGIDWPENIVVWPFASKHEQRRQLFNQLKDEIPGLCGISIEDRDNELYATADKQLRCGIADVNVNGNSKLTYRRWRRWEIENYLLCTKSIALAAEVPESKVIEEIFNSYGYKLPTNCKSSDKDSRNTMLFDIEGKLIIEGLCKKYKIQKVNIAEAMNHSDVPDDCITMIKLIIKLSEGKL